MRSGRSLCACALVLVLAAQPALAGEAQSIEMRSTAAGLGLVAQANRTIEPTGAGRHLVESSMAGVGWQQGGFKASATVGFLDHDFTGASPGRARALSLAASHGLATALGGRLAVELSHTRLSEGANQTAITAARLGWSLRF